MIFTGTAVWKGLLHDNDFARLPSSRMPAIVACRRHGGPLADPERLGGPPLFFVRFIASLQFRGWKQGYSR